MQQEIQCKISLQIRKYSQQLKVQNMQLRLLKYSQLQEQADQNNVIYQVESRFDKWCNSSQQGSICLERQPRKNRAGMVTLCPIPICFRQHVYGYKKSKGKKKRTKLHNTMKNENNDTPRQAQTLTPVVLFYSSSMINRYCYL